MANASHAPIAAATSVLEKLAPLEAFAYVMKSVLAGSEEYPD
jgi:hypothetical protein